MREKKKQNKKPKYNLNNFSFWFMAADQKAIITCKIPIELDWTK